MAKNTGQLIAVAAIAYGAWQGSQGKLPSKLQAYYDQYIGRSGSGTGSSGSGGGSTGGSSGSSSCSQSSINSWAAGISLPSWIGSLFCADFGRLPNSVDELTSWGDSKGYHNPATGAWTEPVS